jgi:GMP synthase (glutamine-hydrolysing)
MKIALAIRHVAFEDLGLFERTLDGAGYQVRYLEAGMDDLSWIEPLDPDLLVVLGGPIGANDEAEYPFLLDELEILNTRLASDAPTLGICLGAQLMARALGARVYPGTQKEIGWKALQLTDDGKNSPLHHLAPERTPVLHWHGDTFDLPAGAVRLASTDITPNQAFRWKKHGLALQFHPEVTVHGLERWYIGHTSEIHQTQGVTVNQLRADATRYGYDMDAHGQAFMQAWLDALK